MAVFPALDPGGTAYIVQLWGSGGGVPISVGCPVGSGVAGPEFEAILKTFGEAVAEHMNSNLATVTRYETHDDLVYQMPA